MRFGGVAFLFQAVFADAFSFGSAVQDKLYDPSFEVCHFGPWTKALAYYKLMLWG